MPVAHPTQENKQTRHTLVDFLNGLLALSIHTNPLITPLLVADFASETDWLVDSSSNLGLRLATVALMPSSAADISTGQSPLLAPIADGRGWLVVYGVQSGRVSVAVIQGDILDLKRVKPKALNQLLAVSAEQSIDWLMVQAQAPLANAVSPDHHHHLQPLQRLLELVRADRVDLMLVLGLALGAGLLALASPVAVQALVNSVAMGGMGQPLVVLSVILFFLLSFAGGVYLLESYLVEIVQRRIFVRLATDLAHRLPKVRNDAQHFHGPESVNRFFDILTVQKAGSALLLDGLSSLVQTLVGLIMLAFYHPFLLAFDIVLLTSIGIIIVFLGRGGVATAIQESLAKYALVAWLEELASHTHSFKFSGAAELAAKRTDALALDYLAAKRSHYKVLLRQTLGSVSLYAVASTALLAIGGYLVIDGHLSLGQLVAAELIVSSSLLALIKFGKHLEGFYDLMAGADKIGHLLDTPLERELGLSPHFSQPLSVSVRDLRFSYKDQPCLFINVSFEIKAGEKLAIIGTYNSGKTTLAQLLSGLCVAQHGQIEFDGLALERLQLDAFRAHIAVVGGVEIVADSLYENVRLGRSELPSLAIEQALKQVGLLPDSQDLAAQTLFTRLSPSGPPLSTTQSQLLMLARAIVGKPKLLIIDGILDQLNSDALARVLPVLCAEDAPWTLLVLTSNPAIAAQCGQVLKLSWGKVHA
ncbi:MAG: ATP-binding cassette domain-containing protein [Methylococcales bacterium]|nr:ATP-binding cassette domain-containing protein [Methylococcales bacterium]